MKKIAFVIAIVFTLSACLMPLLDTAGEYTVNTKVAGAMLKSRQESSKDAADKISSDSSAAKKSAKKAASSEKTGSSKDADAKDADAKDTGAKSTEKKDVAVAASAFQSTDGSNFVTVTGANFKSGVEKKILSEINAVRAEQGLKALKFDAALQSAARIRARELYKAGPDKFAHFRPNGDSWRTVIEVDVPIKFFDAGENLCMTEYNDPSVTYATSADFYMEQWIDSPTHYANIIREGFTHAGVAVYVGKKNGMTYGYAATIFGTPKY